MASHWDRASAAWDPWLRNWHWALFLVPIAVVWSARSILDAVVACDQIDLAFLTAPLPAAPPPIGPAAALAIYGWGLGFVAMCVLAALAWILAARLVLHALPGRPGGWLLLVMALAGALAILWIGGAGWLPRNCISQAMHAGTVGQLPGPQGAALLGDAGNIARVQAWGGGLLFAVGLAVALAAAAALQPTGGDEALLRERADRLRHLMLAAAATLIASIVALHLSIEIGARLLAQHAPELADRYSGLRAAVELEWGATTSLALVALYFPAAGVLWLRRPPEGRAQESGLPLTLLARLLAVASPLLAGLALEIVNALARAIGG
jgi:hypothetical protein